MRREFSAKTKAAAATRANGPDYDVQTGLLLWKIRPQRHFETLRGWRCFNTREAGTVAGKKQPNGYMAVRMGGKLWLSHRVAWAIGTQSTIPPGMVVDHINGRPTDNRLLNLRVATRSQNGFNSITKRNLPKGIYFDETRGDYQVYITANKTRTTRRVKTLAEATSLVRKMREAAHGNFSNHGAADAS